MIVWGVVRAEVRKHFAIEWSYIGNTLSWILYTCLAFVAVWVILDGMTGGAFGREDQLLMLVGWLTWQVIAASVGSIEETISEEAQAGTLEQVCLSPVPLTLIFAARSLGYLLSTIPQGVVAGIVLVVLVGAVPLNMALLPLFVVTLVGGYGLGFLFAGLALVFKRTSSVSNLMFSLMIFLTGALVGLERLGWVFAVTRLLLPVTWGISLMRATLADDVALLSLWTSGKLGGLILHSFAYLAVGLVVFALSYRTARRKGTLGHY